MQLDQAVCRSFAWILRALRNGNGQRREARSTPESRPFIGWRGLNFRTVDGHILASNSNLSNAAISYQIYSRPIATTVGRKKAE
jgi:hypothetical protein